MYLELKLTQVQLSRLKLEDNGELLPLILKGRWLAVPVFLGLFS